MNRRNLLLPLVVFVSLTASSATAADLPTVDQLLAKMTAAADKLASFQADMQSTSQGDYATTATGPIVFERLDRDGKTLEKVLITEKTVTKCPGGEVVTRENKTVSDGTFLWIEARTSVQPRVKVVKLGSCSPLAPRPSDFLTKVLGNALKKFPVRVVGEETVAGRRMYVLDATCTPEYLGQHAMKEDKTKLWIGQDDLIPYRQVSTWQPTAYDQPVVVTTEFLNVKLNEPIDPSLFTYTPPPGAIVTDKSQSGTAGLPSADELITRAIASEAKLASFQADMRMTTQGRNAPSETTRYVFERSLKDGKPLERAFVASKATIKDPDGKDITREYKAIADGTLFWNETRSSEETEIRTTKCSLPSPESPALQEVLSGSLTAFMRECSVKLIGEDTIDGRKTFLLEGVGDPERLAQWKLKEYKVRLWIGQDDLIPYRWVSTMQRPDQDRPEVATHELFNVKVNEKVNPEIFKYAPPQGATLVDKTKPGASYIPRSKELLQMTDTFLDVLQSFQADVRVTRGTGQPSTRHVVFARSGKIGETIERACITSKLTFRNPDGKEAISESKLVSDGTSCWAELRRLGRADVQVTKNDARASATPKLKDLIAEMLADGYGGTFSLNVVGEDTIDARKMFVLEGAWGSEKLAEKKLKDNKVKVWLGQDDWLPFRRVVTLQRVDQGQPSVETEEFLNVKLNEEIDPKLFEYTPPPGAVITDNTQPKP